MDSAGVRHTNIQQSTLSDGTLQFIWPNGYAQIKRVSPGVVFFRKSGFFPQDTFEKLVVSFQNEIEAAGKVVMVCDCGRMENYDSAYRIKWTEFFRAHKGRVEAHIYLRSRFVRMGVAVVNMATGGVFTPHSSLGSLETVLARLVPSFKPSLLPAPVPAAPTTA
jgi:hypothetical protein